MPPRRRSCRPSSCSAAWPRSTRRPSRRCSACCPLIINPSRAVSRCRRCLLPPRPQRGARGAPSPRPSTPHRGAACRCQRQRPRPLLSRRRRSKRERLSRPRAARRDGRPRSQPVACRTHTCGHDIPPSDQLAATTSKQQRFLEQRVLAPCRHEGRRVPSVSKPGQRQQRPQLSSRCREGDMLPGTCFYLTHTTSRRCRVDCLIRTRILRVKIRAPVPCA